MRIGATSMASFLATVTGLGLLLGGADARPQSALGVRTALQQAAKEADPASEDLNELSMQVEALLRLYYLEFTPAQLRELAKLAGETAQKPRARKEARASAAFRTTLTDLRNANTGRTCLLRINASFSMV